MSSTLTRWQPTVDEPWDLRRVVHLHRRAGFAPGWDQIRRDLEDGPDRAIDRLLKGDTDSSKSADFEQMSTVIEDAAVGSSKINRLKAWWLYRMLNTADPLGERLVIGRGVMKEFDDEPEREIVGVVSDIRDLGLNNDPGPAMYLPQAQLPDAANALNVGIQPIAWVVRTRVDPRSLSAAIQEELRQASGLPVSGVQTMAEVVSLSTSRQRFNMWLMTIFGSIALLLAAFGIYSVMAYSVAERTQEIGIRLALGAEASQVKNMVMFQGLRLALVGVVIGLPSAFGLTRFIESFLFGVGAWDPVTFTAMPIALTAVATLAVWLPARRASRIDPNIALRYE